MPTRSGRAIGRAPAPNPSEPRGIPTRTFILTIVAFAAFVAMLAVDIAMHVTHAWQANPWRSPLYVASASLAVIAVILDAHRHTRRIAEDAVRSVTVKLEAIYTRQADDTGELQRAVEVRNVEETLDGYARGYADGYAGRVPAQVDPNVVELGQRLSRKLNGH